MNAKHPFSLSFQERIHFFSFSFSFFKRKKEEEKEHFEVFAG